MSHDGQIEEALVQYRRAVELRGDVPAIRRNLADCLVQLKKFEEAIGQYEMLTKSTPLDANVFLGYGYALSQVDRLPEARAAFVKAVKLDPANARAKQNLEAVRNLLDQAGKK